MNITTEKTGQNIAMLCKQKGWTLKKLAIESKVPVSTLHGYVSSKNPKISHLKKISKALEVSIHRLIYGEADPFEFLDEKNLAHLFSGDVRVTIKRINR